MNHRSFLTDVKALRESARKHIECGAVTAGCMAAGETVIKLLNEALAAGSVCVMRWRHHFRSACRRTVGLLGIATALCTLSNVACANPPFQTDDPGVFPARTGETYLFSAGSRSADGLDLSAAPGAEVNYSFLANTFFHLIVPLGCNDPRAGSAACGPGDVELGFKWRFLNQQDDGIDVATFPLAELPTGSARRGLGSRKASYFLPVWLEKDWGPWTVYGGGGRWFMHDPGKRDWWYSGVLLQRQITPALYLGGELFHETAQTVDGRPSTGFNVGGGYAIEGPWQVLFSAGRNITDVADNRFSYYLALYRTF